MSDPARRTNLLEQSDIRSVTRAVEAVGGINLGQGVCDLPTPESVREDARSAIADDRATYTSHRGLEELRASILEKARTFNDLPCSDASEVVVTSGSTGAFAAALLALMDPGQEAILFEPYYGYHRKLVELMGGRIRTVTLEPPTFPFGSAALEEAIGPNTAAVVLNTPANPSGKVWSEQELASLYRIVERHDLFVVTDEIYEYMTYEGRAHRSPASLPGAYQRTVTISGYSKAFNVTGWRLGYAIGPERLIEPMSLINDLLYICAPTPLQHGVNRAYQMDASYFDELRTAYARRRELLCEALEDAGFSVPRPEGAYYVLTGFENLADRREGFSDDRAAARTVLEEAGVASVPGRAFFEDDEDGAHLLRFCFAKEIDELEEACRRLRETFGTAGTS